METERMITIKEVICPESDPNRPHYVNARRLNEHLFRAHPEKYGLPERLPEVQGYSEHFMQCARSQQAKAFKFIENNCIEYVGGGTYVCKPIKGYNTTEHRMREENGEFSCSCQFYRSKLARGERVTCSHLAALYEYFKLSGSR